MVFLTLLELSAQGGIFILKSTYHLGKYLIWGKQKTKEEILEEKLEEQIEREKRLLDKLEELENLADKSPKKSNSGSPASPDLTINRRRSL